VFAELFGPDGGDLPLVYDVSHNIAKFEEHEIDGRPIEVCVHRKGATRAFPPGHPAVPEAYRAVGQPVLIPGDMGRRSFVAVGEPGAMGDCFGSSSHGAGGDLPREASLRQLGGTSVADELGRAGIVVRAERHDFLAEEVSVAYKDVVAVVHVAA